MAQLGDSAAGAGETLMGSEKLEEPDHSSSNWYFPREHIEKNSPSRKDGIDLKKETYLRKSYCTFLQDLGMRLKVPQVEETPQKLCDVIFLSYEIRNKKDPTAVQRIKQKDVYEPQKELVLLGERLVLTTLGFDLNIHHPYKPLVAAIKKFKVAQNALAQVAWNFVNDGLRTSLCLQFKPHHIAAGAIFLAAKFLKVKLPSEGEKVWWQEFEVTPRQLEEVSNQMLELYEQNREAPASRASDPSASGNHNRATGEALASTSAQVLDKSLAAEAKSRGHASMVRSANGSIPSAADHRLETGADKIVDQKGRTDGSVETDSEPKLATSNALENRSVQETRKVTEIKTGKDAPSEAGVSDQVSQAEPSVEASSHPLMQDGSARHSSVVSHTLIQVAQDDLDPSLDHDRAADGGSVACMQTSDGILPVAIEDVKQVTPTPHQSLQKSEWVDLANVNIDRVKAAIQRRKRGDKGPSFAKRELTDEEALLEMDLENGHRNVEKGLCHSGGEVSDLNSDLEAKVLLERSLEGGKGWEGRIMNSHLQHHYDENLDVKNDSPSWIDEEERRDHKKPRLDCGKSAM